MAIKVGPSQRKVVQANAILYSLTQAHGFSERTEYKTTQVHVI